MRTLQLWLRLLLVSSVPIVAYATASELQQHAEVQPAAANLKFGTKLAVNSQVQTSTNNAVSTAVPRRTPAPTRAPQRRLNATKTDEPPAAPRIARRYDAPAAPTAQLVAQHDIPIVKKSRDSTAAPAAAAEVAAASHKGQRQRSRERAAAALPQRASSQPPPTAQAARARNSHAAPSGTNLNVSHSNSSSSSRISERQVSGGRSKSRKATTTTTTSTTTSTTTTTTAATSTATSRSVPAANNALSNAFNLFSSNFWGFSNPTKPPAAKKPPKKYTPSPLPSTIKEKKLSYQKPKPTTSSATPVASSAIATTTPHKDTTDGPFRIALPTLNFFNGPPQKLLDPVAEKEKRNTLQTLRARFNCPRESEVRFQLFPKICKIDDDCSVWNRDEICCEIFGAKSCVSGIPKPLEETSHAPILGLIPRKCPTRPLAELWWEVQECETDMDCWPRVCCPDGRRRYCRTSQPELETVPVQVKRSFNYLSEYLECTPPPPPIFDLHPKTCASTLDCFPNVCCQESGLRHCRPPKKSVLTLMANFLNVDFVKRLTQNIVIK